MSTNAASNLFGRSRRYAGAYKVDIQNVSGLGRSTISSLNFIFDVPRQSVSNEGSTLQMVCCC